MKEKMRMRGFCELPHKNAYNVISNFEKLNFDWDWKRLELKMKETKNKGLWNFGGIRPRRRHKSKNKMYFDGNLTPLK